MTVGELRVCARRIWEAALDAANPAACIRRAVQWDGGTLVVADQKFSLNNRLIVIGAGKAAARMAQVVEEIFGDHISAGLVVTKHGHGLPLRRIRCLEAGHPIPDEAGVLAVREMRELLKGAGPEDVILCLISGGGSALWPAPAGITLAEKQETTALLMKAGASIVELNAVRKHLSEIKGGQLVRWAPGSSMIALIMSDVIGDPLDFIASGPTTPDSTTFADAVDIIRKYAVRVPTAVAYRLERGAAGEIPDTPKPGDPAFHNAHNFIIANNRLLVNAAHAKARALGFNTTILATELEGEAKEAGAFFAAIAREIVSTGNPVSRPACVLSAGETTVTVRGSGSGGRNQEMALAWAIAYANAMTGRAGSPSCCFASVASDGTDGPTNAAGGLVDPDTCRRAQERGLKPAEYLRNNDSWTLLGASGDLIVTGPTQTNLMDLQILLVA